MSYLVLARKWRPKNFADTVGQEHVLKALGNALDTERLHHAYLFAGTRGVGKTTIARVLAKALNCESGITSAPCGECSACREIDEGRFVDLIEVDAASKTKVDDTRDLLDNVQYAPARGRFKVYLIDEVHMLSKSSFNALLKTLEEPPPHVKFLLATTDPQKLPVTVLSRCLQFNLKRLTPALITDRLAYICEAESIKAEAAAFALIARAADGSLRDALSLLDQAIAFCGSEIVEKSVAVMLGTIDREHVSQLLERLAAADAPGLLQKVAEMDEQFPDYARLLDDMAGQLQRIAVFQAIGSADCDDVDAAMLVKFAEDLSAEDVQLFYQIAITGRRDLHLAPDPRSGVEMTLLRMLAFQPGGEARQPERSAKKNLSRKQVRSPAAKRTPNDNKAAKALTAVSWQEPNWSELIPKLGLTGLNRQLASNCAYLRRDENTIHLGLDHRSDSYLTRERQAALAKALSAYFGEALKIDIVVGPPEKETPVQEELRKDDELHAEARRGLESDPNIAALKDLFGAEIVADSVEPINKSASRNQE